MAKYHYRYQLMLVQNRVYPNEWVLMSGLFYLFLLEMVMALVTPVPFLDGYVISTFNSTIMVNVVYTGNGLLQLFNVVKFVFQLLESFSTLRYNDPSLHRINALVANGPVAWGSPLKYFITSDSGVFMVYSFVLSLFLFSGCALMLERPAAVVSGNPFTEWEQSLWFTIITMMTVGYGDVKPTSTSGKFIIMFIVIWGNFWSSIFLTTVVPFVQLSIQEEKALNLQTRLLRRRQIQEHSAKVVTQLLRFNAIFRRQPASSEVQALSTKTFVAISDLRFAQKAYNFLYNESMINYHDILTKVESEMNLTESQLRRAKTLANVIQSIFNRLISSVRGSIEENDLRAVQRLKIQEDSDSDEVSLDLGRGLASGSSGSDGSPGDDRDSTQRKAPRRGGGGSDGHSSEEEIQDMYRRAKDEEPPVSDDEG